MFDPAFFQAASSDIVRDINRRVVLNLIRTTQPVSRADLARLSGMQRSTVSTIVEDLIERNWLVESAAMKQPRGRRPTYVRLNEDRAMIGVDIRPTQTTIALADVNGCFGQVVTFPTPATPAEGLANIVAHIEKLLASCEPGNIEGVGVALPGRCDQTTGRLIFAPNLPWKNADIRTPLEAATGLPVELENAANACALAALWFDHESYFGNIVVVTVSEGIGTGILVNGQLACGLGGMAGEFGHVSLDPDGPLCTCGSRGCWETFGSNRAAVRYYREATGQDVSFLELLEISRKGCAHAAEALAKMAHHLGKGMRILVAGLAPERILVIGDLTRLWDFFGPLLGADVQDQVLPGGRVPELIPMHEDGLARLRGTVALVLRKRFLALN